MTGLQVDRRACAATQGNPVLGCHGCYGYHQRRAFCRTSPSWGDISSYKNLGPKKSCNCPVTVPGNGGLTPRKTRKNMDETQKSRSLCEAGTLGLYADDLDQFPVGRPHHLCDTRCDERLQAAPERD